MRKAGLVLAALGVVALAAAPSRTTPSCTLSVVETGVLLEAINLPTDEPINVTFVLYPNGGGTIYPTGSFSQVYTYTASNTAYIWQRGGGKSIIKPGPGLNDYHVIAMCSV